MYFVQAKPAAQPYDKVWYTVYGTVCVYINIYMYIEIYSPSAKTQHWKSLWHYDIYDEIK